MRGQLLLAFDAPMHVAGNGGLIMKYTELNFTRSSQRARESTFVPSSYSLNAAPFPVQLVPNTSLADLVSRPMSRLGALPALELHRQPLSATERKTKRCVDIVTRNGLNGRPFQIYRFRSMRLLEDGPAFRQAKTQRPSNSALLLNFVSWIR
jgi:hypothetical protein